MAVSMAATLFVCGQVVCLMLCGFPLQYGGYPVCLWSGCVSYALWFPSSAWRLPCLFVVRLCVLCFVVSLFRMAAALFVCGQVVCLMLCGFPLPYGGCPVCLWSGCMSYALWFPSSLWRLPCLFVVRLCVLCFVVSLFSMAAALFVCGQVVCLMLCGFPLPYGGCPVCLWSGCVSYALWFPSSLWRLPCLFVVRLCVLCFVVSLFRKAAALFVCGQVVCLTLCGFLLQHGGCPVCLWSGCVSYALWFPSSLWRLPCLFVVRLCVLCFVVSLFRKAAALFVCGQVVCLTLCGFILQHGGCPVCLWSGCVSYALWFPSSLWRLPCLFVVRLCVLCFVVSLFSMVATLFVCGQVVCLMLCGFPLQYGSYPVCLWSGCVSYALWFPSSVWRLPCLFVVRLCVLYFVVSLFSMAATLFVCGQVVCLMLCGFPLQYGGCPVCLWPSCVSYALWFPSSAWRPPCLFNLWIS